MNLRFFVLLILVAACVGCGTNMPEKPMPDPAAPPINVAGETLPAIEFFKVRTDIPGGRRLGAHYQGIDDHRVSDYQWDSSFENVTTVLNERADVILKEAGYRLAQQDAGEVLMKGMMRKVTYNSYERKISFTQAEMEVRWKLFRPGEDKPFRTFVTQGAGKVDNIDSGAMVQAFEMALRVLLADPEFPAGLTPPE
jgi:hypothetical protein